MEFVVLPSDWKVRYVTFCLNVLFVLEVTEFFILKAWPVILKAWSIIGPLFGS